MQPIAITTTSFAKYDKRPLEILKKNGLEPKLNPYSRKLKKEEVIELCKDVVGIIAGTETLDADIIKKLERVKVISRCGVGLDNVDLNAAKARNVKVINTPAAPTAAVAELTIGLVLNLLRDITGAHNSLIDGKWEKSMGSLLKGKRAGIIGLGRIGRRVASLLAGFGCEIAFTDPYVENGTAGLKRLKLKELLGWADIVLIHASGTEKILGEDEIRSMKKGSWLVNVSRGDMVDEGALYRALKTKHIEGAAIDTFSEEPYKGPLCDLNNVILTPHIGSYAIEARVEMEIEAVKNLVKALEIK